MPILFLCGQTRSGKDTVADLVAKRYGCTAAKFPLAAPIKEICQRVFLLTDDQVRGPQDERDRIDPRFAPDSDWWRVVNKISWRHLLVQEYERYSPTGASDVEFTTTAWIDRLHELSRVHHGLSGRQIMQEFGTGWGRALHPDFWLRQGLSRIRAALVSGECDLAIVPDVRFRNEVLGGLEAGATVWRMRRDATDVHGGSGHASEREVHSMPHAWFHEQIDNDGSLLDLKYAVGRLFAH